jgi:hypothetical protein
MQTMGSSGSCRKCGEMLIQVEGVLTCLMCASKRPVEGGLIAQGVDPGHDAMEKLITGTGIPGARVNHPVMPESSPKAAIAPVMPTGSVAQALAVLRALPMPSDIKKFKAINKAIKILEDLGA